MSRHTAPITAAGCLEGVRLIMPILPGIATFSAAFGTVALQKGMTLGEAVAMSAFVFAGAAQMVVMELWREPLTPALVLAMCGVVGAVNLRLVLMGAALRPWFGPAGAGVYPTLFWLTDANWVMALRYRAGGGDDRGVFLGSGLALWVVWVASTVPGHLFGTLVREPKAWALDLVMPAFFVVMLVPLWRGARAALPWAAAGIVSLAVSWLVPGYWFIVAGAVAGSLAGAFAPEAAADA